ncbi:hypothetical protein AN910_04790 [Mycobacteroides immunogenum]|nr:hypothetical protein AN910_04790 [Mycobacteroides immunogenum]KPG47372.1 hypothetical protein AN915_04410 [Mycobacteroides immunogenum]
MAALKAILDDGGDATLRKIEAAISRFREGDPLGVVRKGSGSTFSNSPVLYAFSLGGGRWLVQGDGVSETVYNLENGQHIKGWEKVYDPRSGCLCDCDEYDYY